MPVVLQQVTGDDRPVLERLWQLYAQDLSELRGTRPDERGLFRSARLPAYLDDPDRCGYLIERDGLAGFVLVRGLLAEPRVLGEFFILRAARRQQVGHAAALEVIARHPGRWEIAFQEENTAAARFWRRVATEVAGDRWTEQGRPVPDKPGLPPDTWLSLTT